MVELEILFSSGQGILVPMEDRETALRFMQRAMDYNMETEPHLCHLSTQYEEILIDLSDISFIRLKKENYPRLGAIKISAQSSFGDRFDEEPVESRRSRAEARASGQTEGPSKTFTADDHGNVKDPDQPTTFTADEKGNVNADPFQQKVKKAEDRLKDAERQQKKLEQQHAQVKEAIRKSAEELEDAAREAELRKKLEDIEIDKEIRKMKDQGQ